MSLQICDRVAKAISDQVAADFRSLRTSDSVDESSESAARVWVSVFETGGEKWEHLVDFDVSSRRVAAGTYTIYVGATMTLAQGEGLDLDGLDIEGLLREHSASRLSAEDRTTYVTGLRGDPGIVRHREVDLSIGAPAGEHGLRELEDGAFYAHTARAASAWLRTLMGIYEGVKVKNAA
jgi:hypothetical protein